jgi:hypothetical protein
VPREPERPDRSVNSVSAPRFTAEAAGTAPLAIASVTAVLREFLANGLIRYSPVAGLGDVNVTAMPPDRITVGSEEPNQLNLFMYRVAPHAALAKHGGNRGSPGTRRNGHRLALNLHYLLTAYSSQDFHSEILLGCAIHLLNGVPILASEIVRETLQPPSRKGQTSSMSQARAALASSNVLERSDRLRVTQQFMSFEEMSKLWSMLQARYRPSVTYEVSAVIMSSQE